MGNRMFTGSIEFYGEITNARGAPLVPNGMATKAYVDKVPQFFTGDGTASSVSLASLGVEGSTELSGNNFMWSLDPDDGSFPSDLRPNQAAYKEVLDADGYVTAISPNIAFQRGVFYTLRYSEVG